MAEIVGSKAPHIHRHHRAERKRLFGAVGSLIYQLVALAFNAVTFHHIHQIAFAVNLAEAAAHTAVFAQSVLHHETNHAVAVMLALYRAQETGQLLKALLAVEVVSIDNAKRLIYHLLAHHQSVVGAPGFGAVLVHLYALGYLVDCLEHHIHVNMVAVFGQNLLAEIILKVVADYENNLSKACTHSVKHAVIHYCLPVRAETIELFQTAVTASHACGQYKQCRFHSLSKSCLVYLVLVYCVKSSHLSALLDKHNQRDGEIKKHYSGIGIAGDVARGPVHLMHYLLHIASGDKGRETLREMPVGLHHRRYAVIAQHKEIVQPQIPVEVGQHTAYLLTFQRCPFLAPGTQTLHVAQPGFAHHLLKHFAKFLFLPLRVEHLLSHQLIALRSLCSLHGSIAVEALTLKPSRRLRHRGCLNLYTLQTRIDSGKDKRRIIAHHDEHPPRLRLLDYLQQLVGSGRIELLGEPENQNLDALAIVAQRDSAHNLRTLVHTYHRLRVLGVHQFEPALPRRQRILTHKLLPGVVELIAHRAAPALCRGGWEGKQKVGICEVFMLPARRTHATAVAAAAVRTMHILSQSQSHCHITRAGCSP